MEPLLSPIVLYLAVALGGVGVAMSLPRPRISLALFGGLLAGAAAGLVILLLSLKAARGEGITNLFFYAFGVLALGSSLRMITHRRPVYSALYFILTILATAGILLILSAEFMAFALIIIYAGAILITYLFVIMLATQAPTEDDQDLLAEYDTQAREPWLAATAGFVLLGVLTALLFRGLPTLERQADPRGGPEVLAMLPRKVDRLLERATVVAADGTRAPLLNEGERVRRVTEGVAAVDVHARTIELADAQNRPTRTLGPEHWPEDLDATNVERLGVNLLADHPMTIEIAGIVLLMAMLGATVLARKQVELEEMFKAQQARRLRDAERMRMEAGA